MSNFNVITDYPILYKKDKSEKTRIWKISATMNNDNNSFWIEIDYGQMDGKITHNEKEVKEGKNIGKKNETSIEQQTILICDKTFKDKKEKEEYTENMDTEIYKKDKSFPPMLADRWDPNSKTKRKVDIVFPCFIQPKLDGIRCLTYLKGGKIVNQSRQLKYFNNLTHINDELENIFKKNPTLVLDGELYNHDIVFNQIAGIVKKEKLKDEDFEKLKQIQYHVYDCFFENKNTSFKERNEILMSLKDKMKYVKIVSTESCESKDDVIIFHSKFVSNKYEGAILRNCDSVYEFRRSKHLQKFKTFSDDEFEIIDFKEGTGHDLGTVIWKCKTKDDKKFDVRPVGTVQERTELFNNGKKCIGKMLTVTYQELSEFGVPRFPVGKTIRDYE